MTLPTFPPRLGEPDTWLSQGLPVAFGSFEEVLDTAKEKGVFSDLPESLEESGAGPDRQQARIDYQTRAQVIGERLWLLGYVARHDVQLARQLYESHPEEFFAAVERFQEEAGLKKDGWAGKKTWTLLSNLVNFEPLPREAGVPEDQTDDDEPWNKPLGEGLDNRAVMRAASLRLHVLGLAKAPPGKGTPYRRPDGEAVMDLHRLLWSLGLVNRLYGDQLGQASLRLLMDHDVIVEAVAKSDVDGDNSFSLKRPSEWPEENFKDRVQLFLTRLVQIELWLLGSEIDLNKLYRYPVRGIRARPPFTNPFDDTNAQNGDFYDPGNEFESSLQNFYVDLPGMDADEAGRQAQEIKPSLFQWLLNPRNERSAVPPDTAVDESDAYEAVLGKIKTTKKAEEFLNIGRSLGLRIWDGLKRLWRWFKNRVSRIIDFGKNLARVFYRYATRGFSIVKRAIRAVVESVQWLGAGTSDLAGVLVGREMDADMLIAVPMGLESIRISEAGNRLNLLSSRFVFAIKILGIVFEAFLLSTMQRWARLAVVLASSLKNLIPLYRELVSLEALLPG